jgi:hypothetical protein
MSVSSSAPRPKASPAASSFTPAGQRPARGGPQDGPSRTGDGFAAGALSRTAMPKAPPEATGEAFKEAFGKKEPAPQKDVLLWK